MRKCKKCRVEIPSHSLSATIVQKKGFCSIDCAVDWSLEKTHAKARRYAVEQMRRDKQRVKTRSEHMREAQQAFNAYIRLRDTIAGLPCVSCGRHHQGQYHAGHYRSVGSEPALRFCEQQVWLQCAPCNNHLSGNLINYRRELLRRVGEETLNWIEGPHESKKHTVEDLTEIKREYRRRVRELKRTMG